MYLCVVVFLQVFFVLHACFVQIHRLVHSPSLMFGSSKTVISSFTISLTEPLARMRRFLAPPEQAAALAAVRNVRVAEEDLARVAGEKSARWRRRRARLSRRPLWGWRGRSRSADAGHFPGSAGSKRPFINPLTTARVLVTSTLPTCRRGGNLTPRRKRRLSQMLWPHAQGRWWWTTTTTRTTRTTTRAMSRRARRGSTTGPRWKSKSGWCELIEYKARSGLTRVQCPDVFEDVREDMVRNWKEGVGLEGRVAQEARRFALGVQSAARQVSDGE